MGIPTNEWDDIPYPGIMLCQTSSQEILQMVTITNKSQELLSHNKHNANIMRVGDTILSAASEAGIGENWCLLDNQSTCNTFINRKYLSNIRDATDEQYLCVNLI